MKEALKQIADLLQPVAALADRTPFEHSEVIQRCVDASEIALEALAQPAQQKPVAWSSYEYDGIHHKPVAWMDADGNVSDNNDHKCFPIPLYTITHPTPPQRTWVGLTDDERLEAAGIEGADEWFWKVVEAIEAKLKEKNT